MFSQIATTSYPCTVLDACCHPTASQTVAQTRNLPQSKVTCSVRPFFADPSSTISMTATPPERAVRSLLSRVSPNLSVKHVERVPSARLQIFYDVKVSDDSHLLLALPPPPTLRLLRSEQSSIGCEAAVLKWLHGVPKRKGPECHGSKALTRKTMAGTIDHLIDFLPVLVHHGLSTGGITIEYNLSQAPRGAAVSTLPTPLNNMERRVVDYQAGQLIRRISLQISPNRRFGIATDVLSVPVHPSHPRRLEGAGLNATKGAASWSLAFHALLESVLRDAEDKAVMISYGKIRQHFDRFKHLLDAVTRPRLVVVDAGDDMNTLVYRPVDSRKETNDVAAAMKGVERLSTTRTRLVEPPEPRTRPAKIMEEILEVHGKGSQDEEQLAIIGTQGQQLVKVTGLRQWSNCVFGDPLLAMVFNKRSTSDVWLGFERPLAGDGMAPLDASTSLVDDESNAHVRLLLYECYHAAIAVVKEFYRPQGDSNMKELAARRQLSSVLERLDALDNEGRSRRRRPSGEMSPAKRSKQDGVDNE